MVKQQADLLRNAVGKLGVAGKGIIAVKNKQWMNEI